MGSPPTLHLPHCPLTNLTSHHLFPSPPSRPVHYSNCPERLDRMEKTKRKEAVEQDGRLEVLEGQDGVMGILGGRGFVVLQRQQIE